MWMPHKFLPSIRCDLIIQLRSIPIARNVLLNAQTLTRIVVDRTTNIIYFFRFSLYSWNAFFLPVILACLINQLEIQIYMQLKSAGLF